MIIALENLGKKYNKRWIFKDINIKIEHEDKIAIIGSNGSGKSTLLQIIAGYLSPSRGQIIYDPIEDNPQINFSFCAPYLEIIEEYTLFNFLTFNAKFKKPLIPISEMIQRSGLEGNENQTISLFSSGMKQRVKLMICFFFDSKIIFLDEPTSNLDEKGINWYNEEIVKTIDRTIIIASNQAFEYDFIEKKINIETFKG